MAITISGNGITTNEILDGTITTDDISASDVTSLKSGRKNLIINGGFDVWQRGTSFTATGYTADRWRCEGGVQVDRSTDVPSGQLFKYSARYRNSSSSTVNIRNFLEDLSLLLPNGVTWTLSAWVKVTSGSVKIDLGDTDTPTSTSSSWTRISKTSDTRNTSAYYPNSFLDVFLGANTDCYITGVQLELGDTATDFEHRSYGEELALCQRYYCKTHSINKIQITDTYRKMNWHTQFPQEMRATPTITIFDGVGGAGKWRVFGSDGHTPSAPIVESSRSGFNSGHTSSNTTSGGSNGGFSYEADAEL